MKAIFAGLDPGAHGAIALISSDAGVLNIFDMPLRLSSKGKEEVDALSLCDWIRSQPTITLCALEAVHSMPRDGSKRSFSFGMTVGKIKAVLEILAVPTIEPSPQEWKARILAGTLKDKQAAIGYALHRFPGVDLKVASMPKSKKLSDDRAEACCLALFAIEKYKGRAL